MEKPTLPILFNHVPASLADTVSPLPLDEVLSQLPIALMVTDSQFNIIYYNSLFADLFQLDINVGSIIGRCHHVKEITSTFENPVKFYKRIVELSAINKKATNEIATRSNGSHISYAYAPIVSNGKAYHLYTFNPKETVNQITQDANTQKELFENILTNLPSDIAVLNTNFEYLFVNPAAISCNENRSWIIGKNDHDYCAHFGKDPSVADNRKGLYTKLLLYKKPVEWEERIMNKKGETEYHLRKMSPVLDAEGMVKLLIGYGMNITERRKIENLIQVSEKRYRDLFNYSQAMICTHDLEGNLLTVNPALCESIGYSEREIVGKNLSAVLPEADRMGLKNLYLSSIAIEAKAKGVFRIIKKDGSKIFLLYENFKVEEAGIPPYVVGFAQDITERIKAEKELKIAKKITEETALLKERFLANMSHEIRTPMNGIIGMTHLLEKTNLHSEQKKFLKIINESAQNLLSIINDILDIEKIEAGEINMESIPFDLVGKTRSVMSLFEYVTDAKGLQFNFDNKISDKLIVEGDPTRFNQVLNNLIGNAIKFTDKGSITIAASILSETAEEVTLKFDVIDTGIGIEENKLLKIFQPFAQAYADTTRKYGGTGLGLSITKNLLELQGGTIAVQSKLGYGCKFTFTIKYKKSLSKELVLPKVEAIKSVPTELGNIKVLLAEDNEVNQLLAKSILMHWGLETRIATTGNEVIELLNAEDFNVVLMDIQMPEKNGLEATIEIRNLADKRKRNIPIIALTANALKGEEKKYVAVGMDDFLTKPFKEKELLEVISRVLNNKGSFGRALDKEPVNQLTTSMIEEPKSEDDRLYDMNSLNEISRGNKEFIVTLAKIFLNTIPKNCTEMAEAAECKNWDRVSNLAHKLKPTIDTMNIKSIKQEIRAIEINAKNKADLTSITKLINKVNSVIGKTADQLKEQFSLA
ncbi:MAG: PAS domain S-box protein [Chitinophagaceae bacterium]|nr:PAS domain S-box protein [Chitinophagaceae bacterium]